MWSLLRKLPDSRGSTPKIPQVNKGTRKRARGMPWERPTLMGVVREFSEEMIHEPKSKDKESSRGRAFQVRKQQMSRSQEREGARHAPEAEVGQE